MNEFTYQACHLRMVWSMNSHQIPSWSQCQYSQDKYNDNYNNIENDSNDSYDIYEDRDNDDNDDMPLITFA